MPEGKTLEAAVEKIMQRLRSVNLLYIRKIAMQIRKIGELGQASVNRLVAMADMNADIGEITERLRRITAVNNRTLQKVFLRAMNEQYTDSRFGRYLAKYPLENAQRQRIEHYVQAVYRQTAGTLANLSNTTAVTMRQAYIGAIDSAILAASTGVASYTETMRDTLRQIGRAGMQVRYASGYRRRLDTAVRQNIADGINQISKNASVMIGEEINRQAGSDVYDAIEISAHARSAPDHEPVQGHVFMKAEWEKLQAGLVSRDIDGRVFAGFRRPIGEWNCRHTPMSFSTKWSKRKWTDEQLRKFIDENRQGCEIDGKHRTLYEAMQMMREIETAVRREKDTAVAAQAAGDDALRQQCQRNINALVRRYAEIAKASGNAEKRQRMTVEGFRPVKVPPSNPEKPKNSTKSPDDSQKGLTSGRKHGIIKTDIDELVPCLRDNRTGRLVDTEVKRITDYSALNGCTEESGWDFPWNQPPNDSEVYALYVKGNNTIEGLIALRKEPRSSAVYMAWGNAAPHNRITADNQTKKYNGVGGHLFAIAARQSIESGFGGFIYGDAANADLFNLFVKQYGASPLSTKDRPYRFAFEDDALLRILNTYSFDWSDGNV